MSDPNLTTAKHSKTALSTSGTAGGNAVTQQKAAAEPLVTAGSYEAEMKRLGERMAKNQRTLLPFGKPPLTTRRWLASVTGISVFLTFSVVTAVYVANVVAVYEKEKKMWGLLEERKRLKALESQLLEKQ
ncbi:hypothetical protein BJ742DRAFT_773392 [Cladochytrium replicatum]|nr:hypothetical protein BJ742DRAFT_773392 [Cladochytrium replicatum]